MTDDNLAPNRALPIFMKRPASLKSSRLSFSIAACLGLALFQSPLAAPSAKAVSATWTGGAGTTDLNTATNWDVGAVPGATNGDTATWNGTQAGTLALTWSAAFGPTSGNAGGLNLAVAAGQTNPLTLSAAATGQPLGLGNITIAAGAGAFSLGTGSATVVSTVNLRTALTSVFTNNSTNTATIGSDVSFGNGSGIANRVMNFAGTGNWVNNSAITSAAFNGFATLTVSYTGSGTLTMAGANSVYGAGTTIGANGGASVVRAAATQALGTGVIGILGNGGSNRLELVNSISLNNTITMNGKGATAGQPAGILNVSGNNTLSGRVDLTVGGQYSTIQSDSGTLTIGTAGATALESIGGARSNTLAGAGNITVVGNIINGTGTNPAVDITKTGTGTLTMSGANTYTGATAITTGLLTVTGSLSGTSGVTVATGGTLGVNGTINTAAAVTVNGGALGGSSSANSGTTAAPTAVVGAITSTGGIFRVGRSGGTTVFNTITSATTLTPNISAVSVTLDATSTYNVYLGARSGVLNGVGAPIGLSTLLSLTSTTAGASTLGGTLVVNDTGLTDLTTGEVFKFISYNTGALSGTFANAATTITGASGTTYSINYAAGDPFVELTVLTPVPEPGTWAMVAFGFVGAGLWLRRRRTAVQA